MITGEGLKLLIAGQAKATSDLLRVYYLPDSRQAVGAGFPDLVVGGPGGVAPIEAKSRIGRLSADQWAWRHVMLAAGLEHHVLRPADWEDGSVAALMRRLAGL